MVNVLSYCYQKRMFNICILFYNICNSTNTTLQTCCNIQDLPVIFPCCRFFFFFLVKVVSCKLPENVFAECFTPVFFTLIVKSFIIWACDGSPWLHLTIACVWLWISVGLHVGGSHFCSAWTLRLNQCLTCNLDKNLSLPTRTWLLGFHCSPSLLF